MTDDKVFSVRLPLATIEALDALAAPMGHKAGGYVRWVLNQHVERKFPNGKRPPRPRDKKK